MTDPLLPTRFVFRFAVSCRYAETLWGPQGLTLGEEYRLPTLSELDGRSSFADVRAAWNQKGIAFTVSVTGKKHPLWCRESKPDDSDGLQVWIDTRDTHNIHRASRFCHRFVFLPAGGGRQNADPVADQLLVERARENSSPIRPGTLGVKSVVKADGYQMSAVIPTSGLTGYQPDEHPRLGFTYFLFDREFGEQSFSMGSEFPFAADPSLWGTLELVR
jgi:hypothetical protein